MNEEQILKRFFNEVIAKGLTHRYYNRTVERSALYTKLITGEGIKTLLKRFTLRESKELFEERSRLTQEVISAVCKNLMDTPFKVPRSQSINFVLEYNEEAAQAAQKKAELISALNSFDGEEGLTDYLSVRFIELIHLDPNAFIVSEFKEFDNLNERARPYAFEVFSKLAVDYKYINGVLEYLTVKQAVKIPIVENNKPKTRSGARFTIYLKDRTITALEIDKSVLTEEEKAAAQRAKEGEVFLTTKGEVKKLGKALYLVVMPAPHNAGKVPAFRVGYKRDLAVIDARIYVNPFHAAISYLLKTIKVNSELDLVAAKLAYPLRARYAQRCKATGCNKGYVNGQICQSCGGSGFHKAPTSAQEEIILPLPNNSDPKEIVDLEKLLKFFSPPTDVVKWQEEYIEKLTFNARKVVFNTDVFDRKQIAETATGRSIDLENVYDTLYPLAVKYCRAREFFTKIIASFTDLSEGLLVRCKIDKDFKFKTFGDLIRDLKEANASNASPFVIQSINKDLAQKLFENDEIELMRYEAKEAFNPFSGKTPNEVLVIISSNNVTRKTKVLYSNLEEIFKRLEARNAEAGVNFYFLPKPQQNEQVEAEVLAIIAEIDEESPAPSLSINDL